ncbi:toll/interleukin-1 receptor domain-containing protein [Microbacterium sp. MM2322]|uniref:toll/interleukin-1 receptor domain-containing protein n=1 Tax=Microbacterium sp. MM2322 TaxID=3157631 RepID=UPI0032D5732B
MTTTYGIRVIHKGREGDAGTISQAVAQELLTLGLHRSLTVTVSESRTSDTNPHVCVYLGDATAKADPDIADEIAYELNRGTTIFPLVDDLGHFSAQVPKILAFANAIAWNGQESLGRVVRVLFEELGIEDRQRKVFISHRRDDGLGAAEQLHDRLTHFGFQPFIDRFAIREGADVQSEIANALEDHAFLLLLETPLAHTSDWVYDEVDYALSHTMGVLIARWPGDVQDVPGSSGIPRLQIGETEIVTDEHNFDVFTEAGLDRLVSRVEEAHALGLVRRRRMLVKSIEEAARAAGVASCVSLQDWRLLVETAEGRIVVGTTPRLPTASDLQEVDEVAAEIGAELPGLLVHSARLLSDRLSRHLQWVSGGRRMSMIPENAVGGWWTRGN